MPNAEVKDGRVETEINIHLKSAVNLSVTASEATCTSSKIKSTPCRTLSAMTQDWTNYSLCCCISVVLMLSMIIKQNTEIVILTLFPQCPISFYIFDNTLPCKLPEDRRSNFTQVWKVMENDIIQQPSCPGSVPWFMTTTESGSLAKLGPTFY